MLYTSVENKKVKSIKKLEQKKFRDEMGEFIVEGEHLVIEAFKANILKEVIALEGTIMDKIDVEINYATSNVLKYISSLSTPPKVIGICKKMEEKTLGDKILVLDEIQDPGNLGTIIRSCVAFNISDIIVSPDTTDVYSPKVLRATQGMIFNVNIIKRDLRNTICSLKNNGYTVYGTKVNGGKSVKNIEKKEKFAIIMGNEGNGVKEDILDLCSDYIYIDMNKKCESLNVGVATGIVLYELNMR